MKLSAAGKALELDIRQDAATKMKRSAPIREKLQLIVDNIDLGDVTAKFTSDDKLAIAAGSREVHVGYSLADQSYQIIHVGTRRFDSDDLDEVMKEIFRRLYLSV